MNRIIIKLAVILGLFLIVNEAISQRTIKINEICAEICDNGIDDDGDGFIDCLDEACFANFACDCLKSNQKLLNWTLSTSSGELCSLDSLEIFIDGLDSIPLTERRLIWSTGDTDVYSISLVRSSLDTPYVEVRIVEQDQCEETKGIFIPISEISFEFNTSWKKSDTLWCNNWSDSTRLSISSISSGNPHDILWSTGENTLDINFFPIMQMDSSADSIVVWVEIQDSQGGCGRKEIIFRKINCPCPGNPVLDPLSAPTVTSSGDTINIGGLYGCTRYTNTQCEVIFNDTEYNDYHGGIDIKGNVGDTIYSMFGGLVIRAITPCDSLNNYCSLDKGNCTDALGNQIKIRSTINSDVNEILYGHLESVFVNNLDRVKVGQPIGTIGKTGNACASHIIAHTHIQVKDSVNQIRFDIQDLLTTTFNDDATQDSICIH